MAKKQKPKRERTARSTTQKLLDIAEIREDVVILKDGTLRAVLLVSSINFSLKSVDEQNAIIQSYMTFLNSFDFSIQIVIQSRKISMENYLAKLKELAKAQTNELLRMQTDEYRSYVTELVELGEIMTKRFYVVIPYDPSSDSRKGFWTRLRELFSSAAVIKLEEKRFQRRKRDLSMRVGHVTSSLNSIGLNPRQLATQHLIELYYESYNPESDVKLADVSKMQLEEYV